MAKGTELKDVPKAELAEAYSKLKSRTKGAQEASKKEGEALVRDAITVASGGALGIGIGDRIIMLENTWYNVIAPESCSSILWRSWDFKEQAAEALRLTSTDLVDQGIVDRIVPEPDGGAHRDPLQAGLILKDILIDELDKLSGIKPELLKKNRVKKFEKMGAFAD